MPSSRWSRFHSTSSGCLVSSLRPLRLLFSHPAAVFPWVLFSVLMFPATQPLCIMARCKARRRRYWHGLSVLPATDQLFPLFNSPQMFSFTPNDLPVGEEFLGMWDLSTSSGPISPTGCGPLLPLSLPFFFTQSYSVFNVCPSLRDIFVLPWCPRSLASVQLVPWELFPSLRYTFLMHLWREMNSVLTYSSAILPPFTWICFHFCAWETGHKKMSGRIYVEECIAMWLF